MEVPSGKFKSAIIRAEVNDANLSFSNALD
jgi:hypothetical protein